MDISHSHGQCDDTPMATLLAKEHGHCPWLVLNSHPTEGWSWPQWLDVSAMVAHLSTNEAQRRVTVEVCHQQCNRPSYTHTLLSASSLSLCTI